MFFLGMGDSGTFPIKKTSILPMSSFSISNIPVSYLMLVISKLLLYYINKNCAKDEIYATALHLSCTTCNIFEKKVPYQTHCQKSTNCIDEKLPRRDALPQRKEKFHWSIFH